jgi:hypothetical protein
MPPVNAEGKTVECYLHSPVHFHGEVLKHRDEISQYLPGDGI